MEAADIEVLRISHDYLCRQLDIECDLLDILFSKDIITREKRKEILDEKSTRSKVNAFLDYLTRRGPKAFQGFLCALDESNGNKNFIPDKLRENAEEIGKKIREFHKDLHDWGQQNIDVEANSKVKLSKILDILPLSSLGEECRLSILKEWIQHAHSVANIDEDYVINLGIREHKAVKKPAATPEPKRKSKRKSIEERRDPMDVKSRKSLRKATIRQIMTGSRNPEDSFLEVKVLEYKFRRSTHKNCRRYLHVTIADNSGDINAVAFEEYAEKFHHELDKKHGMKRVSIRISEFERGQSSKGFEHYNPDGVIQLTEKTVIEFLQGPIDIQNPKLVGLSDIKTMNVYRQRIQLQKLLVVQRKHRQTNEGENDNCRLELAVLDAPGQCEMLAVDLTSSSVLQHRPMPFCIRVKEAFIHLWGDRRYLKAHKESITVKKMKDDAIYTQWHKASELIDPMSVFSVPYIVSCKSVKDMLKECATLKHGQSKYFRMNVSVKSALCVKENDENELACVYKGCGDNKCLKEVIEKGAKYRCPKCKSTWENYTWRFCLNMSLGTAKIQSSEEIGDMYLGSCNEYKIEVDSECTEERVAELSIKNEVRSVAFDGTADLLLGHSASSVSELFNKNKKKIKNIFSMLRESEWDIGLKCGMDVRSAYGPLIVSVQEVFGELDE